MEQLPSTSKQLSSKDDAAKAENMMKPRREKKRSGLWDNGDDDDMLFFKPKPATSNRTLKVKDPTVFKLFIKDIQEDTNVSNLEFDVLEKDVLVQYSFALTHKIRENGCYSRAIAELVAKISKNNPEFPEMIAKITTHLIGLHLRCGWFILEYLEFITMLNYFHESKTFLSLISLIFFAFVNNERCFQLKTEVIDEFLERNEENLKKLPNCVGRDVYKFMKENYPYEKAFYEKMLKGFDIDCGNQGD